jgi:hypothetical protein
MKVIAFSFLLLSHAWALPAPVRLVETGARTQAGIYQLVGVRQGRKSCWGVFIRLREMRFRRNIRSEHIRITEAKHGHELKELMRWRVSPDARLLLIEFKPGKGDFGSGNEVTVEIDRAAFAFAGDSSDRIFRWSIATDLI